METINTIELTDEEVYPDERVLRGVLGSTYDSYSQLLEMFGRNELSYEWRYYRDGKAWLCKVQRKKRTILWMSAWKGYMQVAIYFPQRYMDQVYGLEIADDLKDKFRSTKTVGKSTPCIFEIRDDLLLPDLEKLVHLKIACK